MEKRKITISLGWAHHMKAVLEELKSLGFEVEEQKGRAIVGSYSGSIYDLRVIPTVVSAEYDT